ncbi:SUKH-4 family immunity protein [Pseudomonas sivasensis]|uniref:SUKH-4 family immunity protein n=1 Tax=Pseudomonas sivasensis TaxID=1880678 RepID=UPI0030D8FB6D
MTDFDFKTHFISVLPPNPPGLDLGFDEFITFNPSDLATLPAPDAEFLLKHGLPRDAAPFLSFEAYSQAEAQRRLAIFAIANHYYPLGHTGSGDVIALDRHSGTIVYFNHDAHHARVLINTSLPQFARSLCVFQAHLQTTRWRAVYPRSNASILPPPCRARCGRMRSAQNSTGRSER